MPTQQPLRQQIADRLVLALRAGDPPPWRRPWRTDLTNTGSPANAVSGKAYRGINVLLTTLAPYDSRWWATYTQIQSLGGRVKKGERATRIVYWRQVEKVTAKHNGLELVETYPLLRSYCVFNVEQCEGGGIERFLCRPCTAPPFVDFTPAEVVIAATNARIEHGGTTAVYFPQEDYIQLPPKAAFASQKEYYHTALHELVHWSGNESRLGRFKPTDRPCPVAKEVAYAFEELVAEIGGCFLCNEVGVPRAANLENHAAYVQHWLSFLLNDASFIFAAAKDAAAAVDFILAFSRRGDLSGEESNATPAGVSE